jgi:tetratricopeptide (TPR) repeat protein
MLNARPSEFVALARLLRKLDDAATLRGSLLLREAFVKPDGSAYEGAESLALLRARAAVLSAVATLDSGPIGRNIHFARQRAIVTRCDLRGDKHATVAGDLGISLREFYRERRRAFERLLALIPSSLAAPQRPARSMPTRFELDLDHIANLRLVGDYGAAFWRLEAIAYEALSAEHSVRALCYGVEIAADVGDNDRARRFFERAVERAAEIASDSESATVDLDVQMACAYVGWQETDLARSSNSLGRAAGAAERLQPAADRHEIRSAVGVLFRCAELACLHGDASGALASLGRARGLLDRLRHKPPSLLGQLFLELSLVQALVVGGMSRAVEYALEALAIFESGQDPTGVSDATGMLCSHLTASRDFPRARHFGEMALRLARTTSNAAQIADKALILSMAESLGGDPQRGLALAREVCAQAHGGLFEVRGPLAAAEAYLRLGEPSEAFAASEGVARYARARGMERYSANASRVAADAHWALGNLAAARDEAASALAALAAHGHPHSLSRAYETASQLGVGGSALRFAAEVRAALHE